MYRINKSRIQQPSSPAPKVTRANPMFEKDFPKLQPETDEGFKDDRAAPTNDFGCDDRDTSTRSADKPTPATIRPTSEHR